MQKLLKKNSEIIRVLQEKGSNTLIIDCVKRTMPKWIATADIQTFEVCSESELYEMTAMLQKKQLTESEKRIAQERFTLIAGILPFIGDISQRNHMIQVLSEHTSKQTIRKYLCLYLVYQDITVLAPLQKTAERKLSNDEKNIRWALNKFFYTKNKNSLNTAYTMMLKEKYCNEQGQLCEVHPSFHQFRYFYRKNKKMRRYYISRDGIKSYQRNNRPLLGDGVQEFASAVGVGMLDATVCDIYLIDQAGSLVGRPILTACVDAYSGLCCGYTLTWEGGVYSLRSLMRNVITNKVEWCKKLGIFIEEYEWNSHQLPGTLVTDMGAEYKSETFEQIAELGVKVVNLPPYRPELKGPVEKFFDLVQCTYKKHLKGKGVIEPDYRERGAHDYRKDACLTMREFEHIILHCIIYYNSRRIIENFPYTEEMIAANVKPYATQIFEWGKHQLGANLIDIGPKELIQVLLPRTTGTFTRKGLRVHSLRYKHDNYAENFLKGGEVIVAYNPENVSEIWLVENGQYIPFTLIESQFKGKPLSAVQEIHRRRKQIVNSATEENLQAQIDLAEHIGIISNIVSPTDVRLKNIRIARRKEQEINHTDFVKEGVTYG